MTIILFSLLFFGVIFFSYKKYHRIYFNIKLGKDYSNPNPTSEKLKNMALIALGQKKMFSRPISAIFHFFIYVAFVFTQLTQSYFFVALDLNISEPAFVFSFSYKK